MKGKANLHPGPGNRGYVGLIIELLATRRNDKKLIEKAGKKQLIKILEYGWDNELWRNNKLFHGCLK